MSWLELAKEYEYSKEEGREDFLKKRAKYRNWAWLELGALGLGDHQEDDWGEEPRTYPELPRN